MRGDCERVVLNLVEKVLKGTNERTTPKWLLRPGHNECRERWPLICAIYRELTNQELPPTMPKHEWRRLDCVLISGAGTRIIEVDETQHFNGYRAKTLSLYPPVPTRDKRTRAEAGIRTDPKG